MVSNLIISDKIILILGISYTSVYQGSIIIPFFQNKLIRSKLIHFIFQNFIDFLLVKFNFNGLNRLILL